ncbi:MAG: cytochrome c oxidase subunit 3, partial [Roseovarius indicus]
MAHEKNHDYHILSPSAYPFIGAVAGFVMLFGAGLYFPGSGPWVLLMGTVGVAYTMFGW